MTGAEALDLIMARLNRTNATLRSNVLLEMKQFQQMNLEKGEIMPDFLITRGASVALTASNRQFTLPSDFLRELDEDEALWVLDDDSVYQPLDKVDYEDGIDRYGSDGTGDLPTQYSIEGLYGYVFPLPTVDRTLKLNYYGTGGTLADGVTETVWLKHASDYLIGGAGTIVTSLYVKDQDAAAVFAAMEQRGKQRLLTEQTARAEAGRSRRMG